MRKFIASQFEIQSSRYKILKIHCYQLIFSVFANFWIFSEKFEKIIKTYKNFKEREVLRRNLILSFRI